MDESRRKRKVSCSGLSIPKRICTPFVSPVLAKHEKPEEKQPDDHICKRIKFDSSFTQHDVTEEQVDSSQTSTSSQDKTCTPESSGEQTSLQLTPTNDKMKELHLLLQKKEEVLRKLNMVKMYRRKNNLDQLQDLINKWRKVSQEAASRLLDSINSEQKATMGQLLNQLQISHELIGYSEDEEGFLSS